MPTRKTADAHRALELLEEYHAQLKDPSDKPLRAAIERIIRIFRSRLFQALLDIQDFYDVTLMDDDKAPKMKTEEALAMAMRWEKQSPMPGSDRGRGGSSSAGSASEPPAATNGTSAPREEPVPARPPPPDEVDLPVQPSEPVGKPEPLPPPAVEVDEVEVKAESPEPVFEESVIVLTKKAGRGLGFSIAGGIDNQHRPGDIRVYCTKVLPNGVAMEDGRLRADDIILQVNDTPMDNVSHGQAVQALKDAVSTVVLRIQRPPAGSTSASPVHPVAVSPPRATPTPPPVAAKPVREVRETQSPPSRMQVVTLEKKDRGLGFSIAGGIGNQHVEGDNGVYVTKIIEGGVAEVEGSLKVNDRLVKVNDTHLDGVSHAEAVQALQRASGTTHLTIEKPEDPPATTLNSASPQPVSPAKSTGYPKDSRKVTLQKGDKGLGFNIVGGEGGEGIYISFILAGGVADLSGQLKRGDQIMDVNGTDLTNASHETAAAVLKGSGRTVTLQVAYRPEEYGRFEQRIQELRDQATQNAAGGVRITPTKQKSSHVRALFDYDKTQDTASSSEGEGLSFRHGDILHLLSAGEGEWWTAQRVNPESGEPEGRQGVIPSRRRVEKKERQKNKGKKFHSRGTSATAADDKPDPTPTTGAGVKRKRSFNFSKRLPFFKKQEKESKKTPEGDTEEPVLSYEDVRQEEISYKRPIVILGPLKDRINDDLIQEFPEKFGSCVPHTTRKRRDYEVDGRDYHFVESREQMELDIQNHLFIEAGQYNENLYGTSVAAVREVAISEQKHCVLDVSGYAIRRLQVANLQPIAVFLKPGSAESILAQNRRIKPEQAQKTYERALKLGEEFAEYFTAIIEPGSPEDMYANVKRVIRQHGGGRIYVPVRDR